MGRWSCSKTVFGLVERPWRSVISRSTISFPISLSHNLSTNLPYFLPNYITISFIILLQSFEYQYQYPFVYMVFFLIIYLAWNNFYFNRTTPVTVFGHIIDHHVIAAVLSVITLLFLVNVWWNALVSAGVSVVVVFLLAVFREPVNTGEETPLLSGDGNSTGECTKVSIV